MTGIDNREIREPEIQEPPQPPGEADPPVETRQTESGPPVEESEQDGEKPPGLLELVYGVLFDPAKTYRRILESPPLGNIALIFSLVKIFTTLTGGYLSAKMALGSLSGAGNGMPEVARAIAPLGTFLGLAYEFFKWFFYSGLLHLLAELFGGRGRATAVFAVTGLASVPALLFLPVNILVSVLGGKGSIAGLISVILWLVVIGWGFVLVVIGLREAHQLSTGRAILVALLPALTIIFFVLFALLALAAVLGASLGHLY